MDELVNFLKDYWQYISIAIVVLFDILLILLKRKPKFYGYVLDLVDYIQDAEKEYGAGHGDEKLNSVIDRKIRKENMPNTQFNRDCIAHLVERILQTPTKKGGLGREKAE